MRTYWKTKIIFGIKVSADIKKDFDGETVYNKNFLKTKVKSYGDEAKDFRDKEIPKVDSIYTSLAVINVDSPLKRDENVRAFKRMQRHRKRSHNTYY